MNRSERIIGECIGQKEGNGRIHMRFMRSRTIEQSSFTSGLGSSRDRKRKRSKLTGGSQYPSRRLHKDRNISEITNKRSLMSVTRTI